MLRDAALASGPGQFAAIQSVAPSFNVELTPVNVRDADEIERAVRRPDFRPYLADGELTLIAVKHPAAGFSVGDAMGRNRLIYALAEAGVVVASGESGGTRAGALENLKAGWVPLFVRDDSDAPDGNRELLDAGGLPITGEELNGASLLERLSERPGSTTSRRSTKRQDERLVMGGRHPARPPSRPRYCGVSVREYKV